MQTSQATVATTAERNKWTILLIGGSSGVGKTLVAQKLARHLSVPLLLVDDIRIALQQATTPAEHPALHTFLGYQAEQWRRPESICDDWLTVGKALMPPLKAIMAHHLLVPDVGPIIIEGDGILPALALPGNFDDLEGFPSRAVERKVRSVFIVEHDGERLLQNLQARSRLCEMAATGTGRIRARQLAFRTVACPRNTDTQFTLALGTAV